MSCIHSRLELILFSLIFCLVVVCVYFFGCGRGQALAQAIKEAKEQHPDMSVTRVVVHKETELAEDDD